MLRTIQVTFLPGLILIGQVVSEKKIKLTDVYNNGRQLIATALLTL